MSRILVVDDKEMMRDSVATTLVRKGHAVATVSSGKAALEKLADRRYDAVITDLSMPEMDGIQLLESIRQADDQLPVILMTAYGSVETAVAAMKQGAYDYITKPFSGDELLVSVERAIERSALVRENEVLRAAAAPIPAAGDPHRMIGSGPEMTALRAELLRIADSHGTVLITGESGSGKEVAARLIHDRSPRKGKPFLAINCAALSTSLLESELFGHEKGAFTGADRLRKGRFELADGGTLLLDEISEVAPEVQAKLLRVLQERAFERVGSSTSRSCDVRVIATTNRDLRREVAGGAFREDLFFRLNVLPARMPSLRERRTDVTELASHFLTQVAAREGKPVKRFDDSALLRLAAYDWPGNVRELQNICERAAVLADGEVLTDAMIAPWLTGRQAMPDGEVSAAAAIEAVEARAKPATMVEVTGMAGEGPVDSIEKIRLVCDGDRTLEDIERETIVATLKAHDGHRQKSARALGIGVRTLGLKLKKWKDQEIVPQTL